MNRTGKTQQKKQNPNRNLDKICTYEHTYAVGHKLLGLNIDLTSLRKPVEITMECRETNKYSEHTLVYFCS